MKTPESKSKVQKLALAALFLALAQILPFLTGQIPKVGVMLAPMHWPVFLCGYLCGGPWGAIVGFLAPLLRSALFGMPPLFPKAICMAFELATYGGLSGFLYRKLGRTKVSLVTSLLISMIAGRLVWGCGRFICSGLNPNTFGLAAFWAGAVVTALPAIISQLILIPILVSLLQSTRIFRNFED